MISLIQGCQVTDDRIIVHDYKQHLLFVFDRKGKYLYSIHNQGNGPGEYLDIRSFCTSADGKDILINDGYKLLSYSLADGTFRQARPLNLQVDNPPRNVLFASCINPSDSTLLPVDRHGRPHALQIRRKGNDRTETPQELPTGREEVLR